MNEYEQIRSEETSDESAVNREQLVKRLADLVGGVDNAKSWLNSPHPLLDGRTPKSYEDEDKLERVLSYFIHAIETGQPS